MVLSHRKLEDLSLDVGALSPLIGPVPLISFFFFSLISFLMASPNNEVSEGDM